MVQSCRRDILKCRREKKIIILIFGLTSWGEGWRGFGSLAVVEETAECSSSYERLYYCYYKHVNGCIYITCLMFSVSIHHPSSSVHSFTFPHLLFPLCHHESDDFSLPRPPLRPSASHSHSTCAFPSTSLSLVSIDPSSCVPCLHHPHHRPDGGALFGSTVLH